jgi:hypothetical protein
LFVVHLEHFSGNRTHDKSFEERSEEDNRGTEKQVLARLRVDVVANDEQDAVVDCCDVLLFDSLLVELSFSDNDIDGRDPVVVNPLAVPLFF